MLQVEKAVTALLQTEEDDNLATELRRLTPEELAWEFGCQVAK